jgi:tetratricopeptide (TPR) repeat protein
MTRLASLVVCGALFTASAAAQSAIPERGLAAEGEGRWADALQMYQSALERNPSDAQLWIRVADIETRLGHAAEAIWALEHAAQADPSAAPVLARLSRAYAEANHAAPALHAIEAALAIEPANDDYLRAHAQLATWAGDYRGAEKTYEKLRERFPQDSDLLLALARVRVWRGSTDAAVASYREYVAQPGAVNDAWLELARAESWRGNFAAALDCLARYRRSAGETPAYSRELAATLARGGRPRQALDHVDAMLAASPSDYDLNLSRTLALAALGHQGDAYSSLTQTQALGPDRPEGRTAESVLQSLLGSTAGPSATIYSDSDGLRTFRAAPKVDIGFSSDTRLQGGYEFIDLSARRGSGLEQTSGATDASIEHVWAGLTQRLGFLTLGGTIGQAQAGSRERTTYSGLARLNVSDTFAATFERSFGLFSISPRTVGLGLTRLDHRVAVDWTPGLRYRVAVNASREDLSDGNVRWSVYASPSVAVVRRQRLNLDLGALVQQFGAREDLEDGYYDPSRYEYYALVLSPYWKASENVGVAITAGLGAQRERLAPSFRFGGNASVEATFGIYREWLLKVNGSTTANRRLESGAFRGYSGGAVLVRRF